MKAASRMRSCCLLLLLTGIGAVCFPQRYTYRAYGHRENLKNLDVNCLIQDRTGFIWAGTDSGLFRYDGDKFKLFGKSDGIPNMEITALAESPEGEVWVGTQNGLAHQTGTKFKTVAFGGTSAVTAIDFGPLGELYLQTESEIILGLRVGNSDYTFNVLFSGEVKGMMLDGQHLYFLMAGDLWSIEGGKTIRFGSGRRLPTDHWDATLLDKHGNLWVRSSTHLFELPHDSRDFVDRSIQVPHATKGQLFSGLDGQVYVTTNSGVAIVDSKQAALIDPAHGFPDIAASSVLVASDNSLWIGTKGNGLLRRLGRGGWLSWNKGDGLLNNTVWAVLHDPNGTLWVGTNGGLNIYQPDGRTTKEWSARNGLSGDQVLAITRDGATGNIFVGTSPGGISEFTSSGHLKAVYGARSGLTGTAVMGLAIDPSKHLWVADKEMCFRSRDPMTKASAPRFERVLIPNAGAGTTYRAIVIDDSGAVWVATSRGLSHFNGQRWSVLTHEDGLKADSINSLAEKNGRIWFAYRDSLGVSSITPRKGMSSLTHYTVDQGLSSDLVYAIAPDANNRVWVSTENGLDVLEGGQWDHYDSSDGLIWDDPDDRSLQVDDKGVVWIGTSQGLSRYDPSSRNLIRHPVPTVITSIHQASHDFDSMSRPELPYGSGSLSVHFSSLDYALESTARFRYRLNSGDAWIDTSEKSVEFSGLAAGQYTFQVFGANLQKMPVSVPAQFTFIVEPPFWRSWWFIVMTVAGVTLLLAGFWKLRVRVLLRQQRHLEKEIEERTEELRVSNSQLHDFAYRDALTYLPNRRAFLVRVSESISAAMANEGRFALILLDLDKFKQVNDTFGHDAGDVVLLETANRIRTSLDTQDFVARLGGDEFAIISPINSVASADQVCSRVAAALSKEMVFAGARLIIGCSTGWAEYPSSGLSQEDLYKAADLALYEKKRANRRTLSKSPSTHPSLRN